MATLIDRDKCQERIFRFADRLVDWGFPKEAEAVRAVAKGIKLEKTVDAVEVPCRCKDCKHWKHIDHVGCSDLAKVCVLANYMIGGNGYCLYGERRTDG